MIEIRKDSVVAQINSLSHELVSLTRDGREYMWGGGKPDDLKTKEEKNKDNWQNSEIIMFPVVGPSTDNKIKMDTKPYTMPQHGIARYLRRIEAEKGEDFFKFNIAYSSERVHSKSGVTTLPIRFVLDATYKATETGLEVLLSVINNTTPFPYAIGWHPAFLIDTEKGSFIRDRTRNKNFTLDEVRSASPTKTMFLEGSHDVCFTGKDRFVRVKSNMKHTAVWSPNSHMFCIEPLTAPFSKTYWGELSKRPGYQVISRGETDQYKIDVEIV